MRRAIQDRRVQRVARLLPAGSPLASAPAGFTPAQLSGGVEYWLAEDLAGAGDGNAVTGNWVGKQLGAILAPFATDMGVYRATAFRGAATTAGLEQSNKAADCQDAAIVNVFNGTNKVYTVWWLGSLKAGGTNYYWSTGALVSTTEYVQCFFSGAAIVKNRMATRDGVINVADNMTENQALAPQLIEFQRAAAGAWTFLKDGISEGTTTRSDSGVTCERFGIGHSSAGSGATAAADQIISAIGITTGLTAGDKTNLRTWAKQRLAIDWKKGLV